MAPSWPLSWAVGALVACASAVRPSPGCGTEPPLRPGDEFRYELTVDGVDRFYQLKLPSGYQSTVPTPLILSFHGWRSSALNQQLGDQLGVVADEETFLAVWPDGHNDHRSGEGNWNSWHVDGSAENPGPEGPTCTVDEDYCYTSCERRPRGCHRCDWTTCVNDVGFVEALLDVFERTFCLDLDMLFVTGFSNGGMFSWQAGSSLANRLAAVSPGGGQPFVGFVNPPDLAGGARISLMDIHGENDVICPAYGGESGGPIGQGGWIYAAVSHAGRVWAEAHGCPGRDVIYPTPWDDYVTCYKHGSCTDSIEVVRCLWDGEHTWPSLPTKADASRMVWWFLKNHPFTGPIPARIATPTHYFNATVPRRVAPTKLVAATPGLRIDV